jgi:hypothetical protein
MDITIKQRLVTFWHYQCPECGFGDAELGRHASTDTVWCEICLEERRHVRLKRWQVEESGPSPGTRRGRGA